MEKQIARLAQKILNSSSFILTTHKSCDADGLGSMIAFHHVLMGQKKKVQSLAVDEIPPRYSFMDHQGIVSVFNENSEVRPADLGLIFDTNDPRLVEPLYSELKKKCKSIIYIDHHLGGEGAHGDFDMISEHSSSTGEICYALFEQMSADLDQKTARALYTSIVFDTHLFRSSKNLSQAFAVCSKLCDRIGPHDIYEKLFCAYDKKAWDQMAVILNQGVQYDRDERVGIIELKFDEWQKSELKIFHLLDCLDIVMKKASIEVGILSVEKNRGQYKVSLRSKGQIDVGRIAKDFGGGGHKNSAGMTLNNYSKEKILQKLLSS